MFLRGLATEGDTQFGITDKQFRFNDFNLFLADDWRISRTAHAQSRACGTSSSAADRSERSHRQRRFRGTHEHRESRQRVHRAEERAEHGFAAVDSAIAASIKADNNHTLKGQDWNNVAPRAGVCLDAERAKWVVRGGYGIFYDRPSAAFINTVFSNYPFLREAEVTFPAERGAAQRRVVAAGSEVPVQSVSAEPRRADGGRQRNLPDSRWHERHAGCRRHTESRSIRPRVADSAATSPRRSSSAPSIAIWGRRTCSSTTSAFSGSSATT